MIHIVADGPGINFGAVLTRLRAKAQSLSIMRAGSYDAVASVAKDLGFEVTVTDATLPSAKGLLAWWSGNDGPAKQAIVAAAQRNLRRVVYTTDGSTQVTTASYFCPEAQLGTPVAVSRTVPKGFWAWRHALCMAPDMRTVLDRKARKITRVEYVERYFNLLEGQRQQVKEELARWQGKWVVALCWDHPPAWGCHRRLLVRWLARHYQAAARYTEEPADGFISRLCSDWYDWPLWAR